MEHILIQVVKTVFNLTFLSEVRFYHSFEYFKLMRLSNFWFEKQKFRDENGTFQ